MESRLAGVTHLAPKFLLSEMAWTMTGSNGKSARSSAAANAARREGPHAKTNKKRRDGAKKLTHATYAQEVVENNETFGQASTIDGQAWLKMHAHILDSESGTVGLTDSGKIIPEPTTTPFHCAGSNPGDKANLTADMFDSEIGPSHLMDRVWIPFLAG